MDLPPTLIALITEISFLVLHLTLRKKWFKNAGWFAVFERGSYGLRDKSVLIMWDGS